MVMTNLKDCFKHKLFASGSVLFVLLSVVVIQVPQIFSWIGNGHVIIAPKDPAIMLIKVAYPEQINVIQENFSASFTDYDVQNTAAELAVIREKIITGDVDCAFVITGETSYIYYVNSSSGYETNKVIADEVIRRIYLLRAMIDGGMSEEQAEEAMSIQINGKVVNLGGNQVQKNLAPYYIIVFLYLSVLLYAVLSEGSKSTD